MDFNQLEKKWQEKANEQTESVTPEMWDQLNVKLGSENKKTLRPSNQWIMIAASIVGLAIISLISLQPKTSSYHDDILAFDQSSTNIALEDLSIISNDFYNVSQVMVLHQAYEKLETNTIR